MGLFDFIKKKNVPDSDTSTSESYLEKYARQVREKKAEFSATLNNLEHADIFLSSSYTVENDDFEVKFSNITSRTKLSSFNDFVVIDIETTGLKSTSSIIELSAVRFTNLHPTAIYSTLVKPKTKIPEKATSVNGITDEMVKDSPKIDELTISFMDFIGKSNIVGHNLEFDLKILKNKGITFGKRKYFDTLVLAKKVLKAPKYVYDKEFGIYDKKDDCDYDVESYSLESICDYYQIYRDDAHRGGSDCLATGLIFIEFLKHIITI